MAVTRDEAVKRNRLDQAQARADTYAASQPVQRRQKLQTATGVKARQTPARRPAAPQRKSRGRGGALAAGAAMGDMYGKGKSGANHIGALEAEFFGCLVLIALTIFTDPNVGSDYGSVMLAAMKRSTMIIILFFVLALVSAAGEGPARVAKGFGALVVVGLILAQAESGLFTSLDGFFAKNWTSSGASGSGGSDSSNANAGAPSPAPGSGTIQQIQGDLNNIGSDLTGGAIGSTIAGAAGALINKLKGLL